MVTRKLPGKDRLSCGRMSEDKSGRSLPASKLLRRRVCIQLARSGLDGYFQGDMSEMKP